MWRRQPFNIHDCANDALSTKLSFDSPGAHHMESVDQSAARPSRGAARRF
jgi:hypothetical protein